MLPLSVLDLAIVTEGHTLRDAIQQSRSFAIQAERLGYTRFWMAEHHNMENIASSATALLLGHVAEATERIRVGSGGIMLPNHSPLIIAEQFGTLATIYPGRIDLGLGRAPGTDQTTASAIRPNRIQEVQNFPQNLKQLQRYLSKESSGEKVRAIPGEGTEVPIWILGSSTDSAFLAAELGLPYAFASHFAPQQLMPALRIYRDRFQPSGELKKPRFMPCINVVAAETDEEADYLATSMKQMFMSVITGKSRPLPPPVEDMSRVWNPHQKAMIEQMLYCSFIGGKEKVTRELSAFAEETGASELMVSTNIFDFEKRLESLSLLSEWMGIGEPLPETH
ncbi:MAG: LLM class flavin-dependent oxidoreductase [Balneolaceae bacterium]|nr:LLM class flavin-dependent oxidoreductase [Balneolaceae bacterium]